MTSRHLIDPELLPGLELFPTFALSRDVLGALRTAPADPAAIEDGLDIEVTRYTAPGPTGAPDISLLVFRPRKPGQGRRCLYFLHGGGYVSGSAAMAAGTRRAQAAELDCVIVAVDYRLAPETSYPGPVEDCYAGLGWLHHNAQALGIDPTQIVVYGNSAGGGLAAGLTLLARDRGEYAIAMQCLLNPMLDDRTGLDGRDYPFLGEFVWTVDHNRFGWASLLGPLYGTEDMPAYASPARAECLDGLPPTFLSIGALDLFLDETLDYARRLIRAGIPTELHVIPGAYHGSSALPEAAASRFAEALFRKAVQRALPSRTTCE